MRSKSLVLLSDDEWGCVPHSVGYLAWGDLQSTDPNSCLLKLMSLSRKARTAAGSVLKHQWAIVSPILLNEAFQY